MESRNVHAEVLNYCRVELLDENYFHAVFESIKGVAERIRSMSGLTTDGAELVNRAFSTQNPILVLGSLATESEKSEQKGFTHLLVGHRHTQPSRSRTSAGRDLLWPRRPLILDTSDSLVSNAETFFA